MKFPLKDLYITEGYTPILGAKEFWIPRPQVEVCDIEPALKIFKMFLKEESRVKDFRSRLELMIDGYNDDDRHLISIPEVRAYYRELDYAFPFWFWFLSKQGDALQVIFQCMITLGSVPEEILPEENRTRLDVREVLEFMERHWLALDELTERFSIPESDRKDTGREVEDYYMARYAKFSHEGKRLFSGKRMFADPRYIGGDDFDFHIN